MRGLLTLSLALCFVAGCKEVEYSFDHDEDGYPDEQDCAPEDPDVNPGAPEQCEDGVDNDCDGYADEGDADCNKHISTSSEWLAVSAGGEHACGIMADGSVQCWGSMIECDAGQTDAPPGAFDQISSGWAHTCGVRPDGTVECWGCEGQCWGAFADRGQCDAPEGQFVQVSAAMFHTCGLSDSGEILCWGCGAPYDENQCNPPEGSFATLSSNTLLYNCALDEDGGPRCWPWATNFTTPPGDVYEEISIANEHACGIAPGGALECWGSNSYEQNVDPEGTFLHVAAGAHHTCAIGEDKLVQCWGCQGEYNGSSVDLGQCEAPPFEFDQISTTSGDFVCGLRSDGSIVCWAWQDFGGQTTPP